MKMIEQILNELGADTLKQFTIIPSFGGYFRSVRCVSEYTREKIILTLRKKVVTLTGENLEIAKYFEEDIFIKGEIKVITID